MDSERLKGWAWAIVLIGSIVGFILLNIYVDLAHEFGWLVNGLLWAVAVLGLLAAVVLIGGPEVGASVRRGIHRLTHWRGDT